MPACTIYVETALRVLQMEPSMASRVNVHQDTQVTRVW